MTTQDDVKHLFGRAGFGMPLSVAQAPGKIHDYLPQLLRPVTPQPLEVTSLDDWQTNSRKAMKGIPDISDEERKMRARAFREKIADLNVLWMQQMVSTDNVLQEKLALFWHGHFATRVENPYFDQLLLQEIRTNALGHFGDLLRAVSKSPAMLQFLNNQQNKKQHPNENFAREVMELFTLGRGHYTEDDIKEAARAFTGWGFDEDGQFTTRDKQHDTGSKTFLGRTGNFNGDDILTILLAQKQTALFVTQKLYRFFVNEEQVDPKIVQRLAMSWYDSGYNISALMQSIFSSGWFYSRQNTAAHVKSPVELLVGMQRTVPMEFAKDKTLVNLQRVLGQQLFQPPNVAGWPGGRAWIDSSSLVIRMRLPEAFFASKELNLSAKEIDAEMTEPDKKPLTGDAQKNAVFRVGAVKADWTAYVSYWQQYDAQQLPRLLADYLLPVSITDEQLRNVTRFIDTDSMQGRVESLTIRLMGLPEYQLC